MRALIIDTSGEVGYLAVAREGKMVEEVTLPRGREMSKGLFDAIVQICGEKKIEFIAVGTGPGTFTGTRIGAIAAEALSYGWKVPLVPFSSSLLPDLAQIAEKTYHSFLTDGPPQQIQLVYISKTP